MSAGTTYVYFFCQRCQQPLKPDASLLDLNAAAYSAALEPLQPVKESTFEPGEKGNDRVSRRSVAAKTPERVEPPITKPSSSKADEGEEGASSSLPETPSEVFVMVKDAERQNMSLSHRLKVATRLFDILSSSSQVDHPLCPECSDMLEADLDEQVREAEKEREYFQQYLQAKEQESHSPEDLARLQEEILSLQEEDRRQMKELEAIEAEREAIAESIEQLEQEELALARQEEEFFSQQNEFQGSLETFLDERDSLLTKYAHAKLQLEKLKKTNVYNDVFRISHDGFFGTINNFRLGRLPSQTVEWSEINAGWGQALLLLKTLAHRVNFKFKGYTLIPNGSYSRIERTSDNKVLDLFTTGELGRLFKSGRSDAMVAFLDCMGQLASFLMQKDRNFRLPYPIDGDKVGGKSIKSQFNETEWTKSLKYTLTNLKWILAWVSQQH